MKSCIFSQRVHRITWNSSRFSVQGYNVRVIDDFLKVLSIIFNDSRDWYLFQRHNLKSFIFRCISITSVTNPLVMRVCIVRDVVIDVIDKAEI